MADRRAADCGCDVGDGAIMLTFVLSKAGTYRARVGREVEQVRGQRSAGIRQAGISMCTSAAKFERDSCQQSDNTPIGPECKTKASFWNV